MTLAYRIVNFEDSRGYLAPHSELAAHSFSSDPAFGKRIANLIGPPRRKNSADEICRWLVADAFPCLTLSDVNGLEEEPAVRSSSPQRSGQGWQRVVIIRIDSLHHRGGEIRSAASPWAPRDRGRCGSPTGDRKARPVKRAIAWPGVPDRPPGMGRHRRCGTRHLATSPLKAGSFTRAQRPSRLLRTTADFSKSSHLESHAGGTRINA